MVTDVEIKVKGTPKVRLNVQKRVMYFNKFAIGALAYPKYVRVLKSNVNNKLYVVEVVDYSEGAIRVKIKGTTSYINTNDALHMEIGVTCNTVFGVESIGVGFIRIEPLKLTDEGIE